jgi:hypothetical protein
LPALEGRRIWLVGIGGAGLSGYALLARAWGAEVAGWDRNETVYLGPVREAGIVTICRRPEPPDGWEVFVSSAYPDVPGRPRAELLAELVARQGDLSPARTARRRPRHDRLALRATGRTRAGSSAARCPSWARTPARVGWPWSRRRVYRSVFALRLRSAVVTTSTSPALRVRPVRRWRSFFRLAGQRPGGVGLELAPLDSELAVPGEHNRRTRRCGAG